MSKQLDQAELSIESEMNMEKNDNNSQNAYTASNTFRLVGSGNLMLSLVLLVAQMCGQVQAWGGRSSSTLDYSVYGNAASYDWLYDGSTLSIQVLGCVWGVVEDSEEAGCLEDESEDGTYNWYMMANCRRPQVAYSVFSSSGCSNSNFVGSVSCIFAICRWFGCFYGPILLNGFRRAESTLSSVSLKSWAHKNIILCFVIYFILNPKFRIKFMTTTGVSEFIYGLQQYDNNFKYDDDNYGYDDLPECYGGDYGYVGMGCSDGGFALNYYNDQYCMSRTGETYDNLNGINTIINSYKSCTTLKSNNGEANGLVSSLIAYSTPCMALDFQLCTNDANFIERSNGASSSSIIPNWTSVSAAHQSWITKLKYVIGGGFLLASFIMFTGILFTNRRRRRAMMMRKYRQAKKAKRDKGREGSKSRKSRSSSKRRSKSKSREKSSDGVFT